MQFLHALLPIAALIPSTLGQVHNTTREFNLKTVVTAGQKGKAAFNNLWLGTYHTGAGLNDVVFSTQQKASDKAFLNATSSVKGQQYSNLIFDLGSSFPWNLVVGYGGDPYAAWGPTAINQGNGGKDVTVNGFYIDAQGLQWTPNLNEAQSKDGTWLVCDWWHLSPQLFFSTPGEGDVSLPSTCARVQLQPVYI